MNKLLQRVQMYVQGMFHMYSASTLTYHNYEHTKQVAARAVEILENTGADAEDKLIVTIAAWFHDIGYLFGGAKDHEERGAQMMAKFLRNDGVDNEFIEQVAACIMATKVPAHPGTLKEQVICDADTYHLGTEQFFACDQQVNAEVRYKNPIGLKDWNANTLAFLNQHQFYTDYCKAVLNEGKQANIRIIEDQLRTPS
jgi:putative nucleotidyltransferase with HDIG domain